MQKPLARSPKTTRRQMTDIEKGMIIGLFYAYGVVAMVAKIVRRPWSTVKSFLDRTLMREREIPRIFCALEGLRS